MKKNVQLSISEFPIPMSSGVEDKLIAMLIDNPEYISDAMKVIVPTSFVDIKNTLLWNLLVQRNTEGDIIDMPSIYPLSDTSHFQQHILPHLVGTIPISEAISLIQSLHEIHQKRIAYFTATEMLKASTSNESYNIAKNFVEMSEETTSGGGSVKMIDAINEYSEELSKREENRKLGKRTRIPTCFPTLDRITSGGFAVGNLVILAARPSIGKSAVALQLARMAALQGVPTVFFSLEMTNNELVQRLICSSYAFNSYELNNGIIDWKTFDEVSGGFSNIPLWLNDKLVECHDIINEITIRHKRGQCNYAVIDYLGLITDNTSRGIDLRLQITMLTRNLKILAKNLRIPIVLLCQLNRDMSKEGREPQLHDLRESGSIEQDADIVLMLTRAMQDPVKYRMLKMFVRKNRQGPLEDIFITGNENLTCFVESSEDEVSFYNDTEADNDEDDA